MSERRVVIGVGNAYRGDDGAGLAVAEGARGRLPADVDVLDCEQEPTRLLDLWESASVAVVVDAVVSGAPAGTVHRFDASDSPCLRASSDPRRTRSASATRSSSRARSAGSRAAWWSTGSKVQTSMQALR